MDTRAQATTPCDEIIVTPGSRADRATIAAVLAEAFSDDEYTLGLLPAPEHRRLVGLFDRLVIETIQAHGHVYLARSATTGDALGAALWATPDGHVSFLDQLTGLGTYLSVFGHRLPDALRTDRMVNAHRPSAPHWYLKAIGTTRAARGRGAGAALMQQGLTQADAAGVGAYLESSKLSNVPYYAKYGFREISTVPGVGTIDSTGMWRPAR